MRPFTKVSEWGFRPDGSCWSSETIVDNSQTRWIREMLADLHKHPMSPSEVATAVDMSPEWIRSMFTEPSLEQWRKRNRYRDWPGCMAATSAERVLIDRGRGQPLWLENDRLWEERVTEALRLRPELG